MAEGEFVKVAMVEDVQPGIPLAVQAGGHKLAMCNIDGEMYAIDEMCTHADASLCDGDIEGCSIVCPLHFGSFDIKTGEALDPPACVNLKTWETKVVEGEVHVRIN
ncbi:MAG: non-heme iron oxygenase ferredoxin subunit [Phycisphaerales bacterium]|nr:non-heme iron oxygenase ferredoxin subunit [Phycisphaerales bacterium]